MKSLPGPLHELMCRPDVHALVFDLDGTLIDSAADIIGGMRLTLSEAGVGELPHDYIPDNLHGTTDGILRSIVNDMGWPMPADLIPLRERYAFHYDSLDHRHTRLDPGVVEMLEHFSARVPLGICTNKRYVAADGATTKVGIRHHFHTISGADTWPQAKPSPVPLLETLRVMGVEPQHCLYFGDTSADAECAAQAGVRFVLHESGYGDARLHQFPRIHAFKGWVQP